MDGWGRKVRDSYYPSLTTGGAQRRESSGQWNVPGHSLRTGRPENLSIGNIRNWNSARTSRWRNSNKIFRIIETVDGLGNIYRRKVFGRMSTTEGNNILNILERRACHFRPELWLLQEQEALKPSIDKTGTLSSFKADWRERERESQACLLEEMAVKDLKVEVLEIHDMVLGKKADGVIRLLYENATWKVFEQQGGGKRKETS